MTDSSQTGTGDGGSALGRALAEVLRAATVTNIFGELRDDRPADVLLDIEVAPRVALDAALAVLTGLDPTGALSELESTPAPVSSTAVAGTVILQNGRLSTMTFELGDLLVDQLGAQAVTGAYVLTLDVAQANEVVPIERPPVVATLTFEQLQTAIDAFGGLSAP